MLRVLLENSQIEQGMKKIEERDQLFGRLFGILAIFRSTRLVPTPKDTSFNVVKKCTEEVLNLYMSKRWLREICIQTFLTMLRNVHVDLIPVILEGTLPLFQEQKVMENEEEELLIPVPLTCSSLFYLLGVKTLLHQRSVSLPNEDLERVYQKNPEIEPNQLKSLMHIYRESTFTFPKIHPLWQATIDLIREVSASPNETLMEWWEAVTEHVMTTTAERRRYVKEV